MTKKHLIPLIILLTLLSGCHDREREERLTQRERNLFDREKSFAMKEAEYQALLKMRDSLMTLKEMARTVSVWPPEIEGFWNGKIICVESNCTDYVIGDIRNDTWEFASDSTQLVVKVVNNTNLVRVYKATYSLEEIQLTFNTDSSVVKQAAMQVNLTDFTPNKIKGIRTITIDNKCTARFSVELSRINPK